MINSPITVVAEKPVYLPLQRTAHTSGVLGAPRMQTDFIKHHLSRLEQESKDEAGDYEEQRMGLEATIKEISKQMKDQERRAKKTPRFSI